MAAEQRSNFEALQIEARRLLRSYEIGHVPRSSASGRGIIAAEQRGNFEALQVEDRRLLRNYDEIGHVPRSSSSGRGTMAAEQRSNFEALQIEARRLLRNYEIGHVPRLSSYNRGGGGLSSEIISKNLQTRVCGIVDGNEICAICCDEFCQEKEITKTIGVLKCGHGYHVKCIEQWLLRKNMCPICRDKGLEHT